MKQTIKQAFLNYGLDFIKSKDETREITLVHFSFLLFFFNLS